MWVRRVIPQDFKDASIVDLYKRQGNHESCDNHLGISLLSIAGKVLARVLLNRLIKPLERGHLPESQYGFRAGRGTVDMIDLCCFRRSAIGTEQTLLHNLC